MNNEIFILYDDYYLINGIREIIKKHFSDNNARIIIKQVSLIELMNVDIKYKSNKRYTIAVVPDIRYETLRIFAGMENIKMVPSNVSLDTIFSLLTEVVTSGTHSYWAGVTNSLSLTAKERRYCYLVFRGISNKKIARYFQCTEKNISYLKRKIMSKWQCKNSLDFYMIINYFYGESESIKA